MAHSDQVHSSVILSSYNVFCLFHSKKHGQTCEIHHQFFKNFPHTKLSLLCGFPQKHEIKEGKKTNFQPFAAPKRKFYLVILFEICVTWYTEYPARIPTHEKNLTYY